MCVLRVSGCAVRQQTRFIGEYFLVHMGTGRGCGQARVDVASALAPHIRLHVEVDKERDNADAEDDAAHEQTGRHLELAQAMVALKSEHVENVVERDRKL